jgi:hypothetical protein
MKILQDTVDTNLKARGELRRLLTGMEEQLRGRSGKRRELLEEDKRSMPCAADQIKKRKLDPAAEDGAGDGRAAVAEIIDVDAGDLDSFPLI